MVKKMWQNIKVYNMNEGNIRFFLTFQVLGKNKIISK